MAKNYIDNLSDETQKALRERLSKVHGRACVAVSARARSLGEGMATGTRRV